MQGSRAFETTSMPIVKSFRYTATACTTTNTTEGPTFRAGSMILGFQGVVTAAFSGTVSGTPVFAAGFTGTSQLSVTTALTAIDAVGDVVGPAATNVPSPITLLADDTFDVTISNTKMTGGEMDFHVLYVPPADGYADSTFKEYAAT